VCDLFLFLHVTSFPQGPTAARPASAAGVALAEFGAIKILVEPKSRSRARIQVLMHVDLKASSLPQVHILLYIDRYV